MHAMRSSFAASRPVAESRPIPFASITVAAHIMLLTRVRLLPPPARSHYAARPCKELCDANGTLIRCHSRRPWARLLQHP